MSNIKTVGELRAIIADLPDNMPVVGWGGYNRKVKVWVSSITAKNDQPKTPARKVLKVDLD